jgi:hypothetical protein
MCNWIQIPEQESLEDIGSSFWWVDKRSAGYGIFWGIRGLFQVPHATGE